ncbi:prohead protease/major capsid protein fusion protein [uncultured Agrobacterium sp.]|uniref:prohead protease/major capsid protein fusion protein n=1 Tax=uncultured Agrobacterium sp. TaxID=157277 RepID=UPI0025FB3F1A|nr:prohead protease/major capsid protein fusion protein [uncultured Agrobacterium sp.]
MASNALRKAKAETNLRRAWGFQPDTLDVEERTVWVIAATETKVKRSFFDEVLLCEPDAVVSTRLQNLPVLDSHRSASVKDILGQVVAWRFEGRKLLMQIRFADNEGGNAAFALVRDGMLGKVSVGYRILKAEETETRGSVTVTITRWEPTEISLVSVPADPNATIRGNVKMAKKPTTNRRAAPQLDEDFLEDDIETGHEEERRQPVAQRSLSVEDTQRLFTMRDSAVRAGFSASEFDEIVSEARGSMRSIRSAYNDMMASAERQVPTDSRVGLDMGGNPNDVRNAVIDALAVRLGATSQVQNNPYAGRSSVEIGRRFLEDSGVSTRGMDDVRVADILVSKRRMEGLSTRAMHTTSDFPLLLQAAGNRALLQRYEPLASPLKSLSSQRNARDFRQQSFIRPGEAPLLEKVHEAGEIKSGTTSEDSRGLKIDTYGKMFAISRQALVNDDLGAFSDFLGVFAQSAAETEGNLFANLLLQNQRQGLILGDGKPLFHPDRKNMHGEFANGKFSYGSDPTVDSVTMARQAMRTHKNTNGTGSAGVVPAVLLVGPEQETYAEKLVALTTATNIDEVNPFAGKLRVMVENRIEGRGWYLFADPAQRPALMHGYLDGAPGPQVESEEGWRTLGTEFRCILDFGCGVLDWRSIYFNPGQP